MSARTITVGVSKQVWVEADVEIDPAEVLRELPDREVLAEATRRGMMPRSNESVEHPLDPIRTHIEDIELAFRTRDRQHFRVALERLCQEIGLVMA